MNKETINSNVLMSVISGLPFFSEMDADEFNIVKNILKLLYVKKGEFIFREGDSGEEMFILFSGALSAYARQSDGNQKWLFDVKLGDFFGEMSIIANEPRSAAISAQEDSVVVILRKVDFFAIISQRPVIGYKILKVISTVQNQWLDQSSKSYSDLTRWGETARRRAITDEMTGLYNRRFLEDSIKERFNNSSMNFRIMSLLMMDLDKIHSINDCHGTKAGDLVITAAANTILSCLRPSDIPARLSGDEFAILLPDTDREDSKLVAERIREKIEACQIEVPAKAGSYENVFISTRTSIGIALAPVHAGTTEELFDVSDSALRKAKELGRNRVEVYSN